jgi:hypothetical protein
VPQPTAPPLTPVPHWVPTNISRHNTKYSRHGDLACGKTPTIATTSVSKWPAIARCILSLTNVDFSLRFSEWRKSRDSAVVLLYKNQGIVLWFVSLSVVDRNWSCNLPLLIRRASVLFGLSTDVDYYDLAVFGTKIWTVVFCLVTSYSLVNFNSCKDCWFFMNVYAHVDLALHPFVLLLFALTPLTNLHYFLIYALWFSV